MELTDLHKYRTQNTLVSFFGKYQLDARNLIQVSCRSIRGIRLLVKLIRVPLISIRIYFFIIIVSFYPTVPDPTIIVFMVCLHVLLFRTHGLPRMSQMFSV